MRPRVPVTRRVAEIWVPDDPGFSGIDPIGTVGSGYLVASRAVLTAGHVVAGRWRGDGVGIGSPTVEVRLLREKGAAPGPWLPAEVAWEDEERDVALLKLVGDQAAAVPGTARWAVLGRDESVYAIGFPLVEEMRDGGRDTDKVTGEVLYEAGWVRGRLAFDVRSSTPVLPARSAGGITARPSGWQGLSGAGLLTGDLLVGIVVVDHDPGLRRGRRLEAVPVAELLEDSGFCAAARSIGLRPKLEPLGASRPEDGTEGLLRRHVGPRVSASVEYFMDRSRELAELREVLERGTPRIVCVTGGRGSGKSALACAALAPYEQTGDIDGLVYATGATSDLEFDLQTLLTRCLELVPKSDRAEPAAKISAAPEQAPTAVLQALWSRHLVILLDNVDAALAPDNRRRDGLLTLIDAVCRNTGSSTIVTTSERPPQLPPPLSGSRKEITLQSGLPPREAVRLLKHLGASGPESLRRCSKDELSELAGAVFHLPRGLELCTSVLELEPETTVRSLIDSLNERDEVMSELSPRAMDRLSDDELLVLRVVAVLGEQATDDAVSFVVRELHQVIPVGEVLNRLCRVRLLARGSPRNRLFFHPLDIEIALARTPGSIRRSLHAAAAEWFATQRTDPVTWRASASVDAQLNEARHRLGAGQGNAAVHVLDHTIWSLLVWHGGSRIAAELLSDFQAVSLDPLSRLILDFAQAEIVHHRGSPQLAADLYRRVADEARSLDQSAMRLAALDQCGNALRYVRCWAEAVTVLQEAADVSRDDLNGRGEGDLLFHLALVYAYQREQTKLDAVLARMERIRSTEGAAAQPGRVENIRCVARMLAGDFAGARDAASQAVTAYDAAGRRDNAGFGLNSRALSLMAQEAWDDAEADLSRALKRSHEYRVPRLAGYVGINLTWLLLTQGRFTEAGKAADAAHAELEKQDLPETTIVDHLVRSIARLRAHDLEGAASSLADAVTATAGNLDFFTLTPAQIVALCARLA